MKIVQSQLTLLTALSLAFSSFAMVSVTQAQNNDDPLTKEVIARAIQIERSKQSSAERSAQSAVARSLATTKLGKAGKSVVVSVRPIGSASTRARAAAAASASSKIRSQRALVTRYNYDTGRTVETTVDLSNNTVLSTRTRRMNYPTPLAQEEKDAAKRILLAAVPEVAKFAQDHKDAVYYYFPSKARFATNPLYGHRLVRVWAHSKEGSPIATDKYLVDLSTEEIVQ